MSEIVANREVPYALKVIDKMNAAQDFLTNFMPKELKIWNSLHHKNIVEMYSSEEMGPQGRFVVMKLEYVDGCDMLEQIRKPNGAPEHRAKGWFLQLVSAVEYMHKQQLAHRDLKLENLLLDSSCETVKICDFGFSRYRDPNKLSSTFCGSRAYASPQILKGEPYQILSADIWALGVSHFFSFY